MDLAGRLSGDVSAWRSVLDRRPKAAVPKPCHQNGGLKQQTHSLTAWRPESETQALAEPCSL